MQILEANLPNTQLQKLSSSQLQEIAEKTLQSLTVVMEFMDKGIKGLLTGDLTIYMIQSIESTLDKYHSKLIIASDELKI